MTAAVLYENADLLAVNKPAGIETSDSEKSLTVILRRQFGENLLPAHRLDRDTSGVLLFAKNVTAAQTIEDWFRKRLTQKFYLAACVGIPANLSGTIRRNLSKWRGGYRPVQVVKTGGLTAETFYQVLAVNRASVMPASLLLFQPKQGRTHQIRVHAAAFGRPVLGDDQYGDRSSNRHVKIKRQALHAWRLVLPSDLTITAAPPPDLQELIIELFGENALAAAELKMKSKS